MSHPNLTVEFERNKTLSIFIYIFQMYFRRYVFQMSSRDWDLSCKVYIGNLANHTSRHDIESAFGKYGSLRNVWVARNPPGFAFVEFDDARDAEDACRALDGSR